MLEHVKRVCWSTQTGYYGGKCVQRRNTLIRKELKCATNWWKEALSKVKILIFKVKRNKLKGENIYIFQGRWFFFKFFKILKAIYNSDFLWNQQVLYKIRLKLDIVSCATCRLHSLAFFYSSRRFFKMIYEELVCQSKSSDSNLF